MIVTGHGDALSHVCFAVGVTPASTVGVARDVGDVGDGDVGDGDVERDDGVGESKRRAHETEVSVRSTSVRRSRRMA